MRPAQATTTTMMKAIAYVFAIAVVHSIPAAVCDRPGQSTPPLTQGPAVYTASSAFPTSEFSSMDFIPSAHEAVPRPVITSLSNGRFNDSLVNPTMLPNPTPTTTGVMPEPTPGPDAGTTANQDTYQQDLLSNFSSILVNKDRDPCGKCHDALRLGQAAARTMPAIVPDTLVQLCKHYNFTKTIKNDVQCEDKYSAAQMGPMYTQVLNYVDLSGGSSAPNQSCNRLIQEGICGDETPQWLSGSSSFDVLDSWFNNYVPPPDLNIHTPAKKTGPPRDKRLRVLHLSDIHLDPRYMVGAEANCDSGQCCRADSFNSTLAQPTFEPGTLPKENISEPAGYWGWYQCDSPWSLVESAMQAISALAEKDGPIDLGIVTGDLVTHDSTARISPDLVRYSEQSIYDLLKRHTGNATISVALGSSDTAPPGQAMPDKLPNDRGKQLAWDYENIAALVKSEGWGNDSTADSIRTHYGGYSISPREGLRIISINSDFWYSGNLFNYINPEEPDPSGAFHWLTDELYRANAANERAWIIASVPTGWDTSYSVLGASNLFNYIVSHYAATIAHIFFGHTHKDQFHFFPNLTSTYPVSGEFQWTVGHALIAPSLTPNFNLQPSFRIYEIDPESYEVMDYHQYYTIVDEFRNSTDQGPVWRKLYSAREAYGNFTKSYIDDGSSQWPSNASLNTEFWFSLQMEYSYHPENITPFYQHQTRNSPRFPLVCDRDCALDLTEHMKIGNYYQSSP